MYVIVSVQRERKGKEILECPFTRLKINAISLSNRERLSSALPLAHTELVRLCGVESIFHFLWVNIFAAADNVTDSQTDGQADRQSVSQTWSVTVAVPVAVPVSVPLPLPLTWSTVFGAMGKTKTKMKTS